MDQADYYANIGVTGENDVPCECEDCGCDHGHSCFECGEEISENDCTQNDGLCDKCFKELK